jgi:hypothetical protein
MWHFYAFVVVVWLALMPPLFTGGACTAEYDAATNQVVDAARSLKTPQAALEYFRSRSLPAVVITPEQCRQAKPRFLDRCSSGSLIYAKLPVRNKVCSLYRDDEVKVQVQYDDKGRLVRLKTDMAPFKSLPIPFFSSSLYWAR